ncbi:MAG: minor capsid protein [Solimonas sp.]
MIRALAEYLITQAGLTDLVIGSTLWIGPVAEADLTKLPDRLIVLVERPGPPEEAVTGELEQARLQVLTRNTTLWNARDLAGAVHRALHSLFNKTFQIRDAKDVATGTMEVWSILANATPAPIGIDARGRHEFSANYTITRTKQ